MSELPFYFHAPTPRFFRDNDLFKNPKNKAFVDWCFERCSPEERTVFYNYQKITLKPYQFIFGRDTCIEATGLTENEVRTQQKRWENYGYLKNITNKTTNKTTKRFTIYEWVLTDFIKNDNQQNNQQNNQQTTKRPPRDHHNQEYKIYRSKEDHHPYPSSKILPFGDDDQKDGLTDDFSSKNKKQEQQSKLSTNPEQVPISTQSPQVPTQHNIYYKPQVPKIEVYTGVFLTQEELDECLAIKGSLEAVKTAIEHILRSPGRKCKIYNWPATLSTWQIKSTIKPRAREHEEMGLRLEQEYSNVPGWCCNVYTDRHKDQKGILFYNSSSAGNSEPVFISFVDPEFKQKTSKILREKRMQKGRISNS